MTGSSDATSTGVDSPLEDIRAELIRLRAERQQVERGLAALNDEIELLARQAHRTATRSLRRAALRGDGRAVRTLLTDHADIDVNARNRSGATALFLAVHKDGNSEVVRLLLVAGADPNRADFERTMPLITAVRPGQLDVVRLLVEAGATLDVSNRDGDTPLTNAAAWGSGEIVQYLLDHGADPTLVDGVGLTAAQLARQQEHGVIADALDSAGIGWRPTIA